LAHLLERRHITGEGLAIGELIGAVGALGIEIVEKAGGAAAVGIFADVAGLLGFIHVAALIELNDLVVGMEIFIGIDDIGEDLLAGFTLQLLGLVDDVASAQNFALIAVEDGELEVEEKCAGIYAGGVRIVEGSVQIALSGRVRSARPLRSSRPAFTG
jgi:hypothetical protein